MDAFLKAAQFLVAIVGFVLSCVTPVAAEDVHFYNSPAAAAAKLPFSQAVRVGDVLYMSGAIGVLPGKLELAPGGIEPETKQMMENITDILKANGLTFDDVFKCTAMLADMSKWGAFNKIYVTYFKPEHLPDRSDWLWVRKWNWNAGLLPANNEHDAGNQLRCGRWSTPEIISRLTRVLALDTFFGLHDHVRQLS